MKVDRLFFGLLLGVSGWIGTSAPAIAQLQVVADPALRTVVTPNGSTFQITGGTTVGGRNLFHSFSQFSVPIGGIADFQNAATLINIFARVAGDQSDIRGIVRSRGSANLFLMNPSGIIFGTNAQLNVGGSFVATTANVIEFPGGAEFSLTSPVNAQNPLLVVNPSAFLFNQIPIGQIANNSTAPTGFKSPAGLDLLGLRVPNSQSLLLVGGDIRIDGGNLNALGGHIELGGLATTGRIGLNTTGNLGKILSLSFPQDTSLANISLTNNARIGVRGTGGGDIIVNANILTLANGGRLTSGTEGTGKGGDITVNATQVNASGVGPFISGIFQQVLENTSGSAGNITIKANSLSLASGAQIQNVVLAGGKGNAGDITLNVADAINLTGTSPLGQLRTAVSTETLSSGNAGNLTITTKNLSVLDGAILSTGTFGAVNGGKGGNLTISASDLVAVVGASADTSFRSEISAETQGSGDAGNLTLNTRDLNISGGGTVSTGTFVPINGEQGGSLTVNVNSLTEINPIRLPGKSIATVSGVSGNNRQPNRSIASVLKIAEDLGYGVPSISPTNALRRIAGLSLINTDAPSVAAPVSPVVVPLPLKGGNGGSLIINASGSVDVSGTTLPLADGEIRSSLNSVVGQNAQGQGGNLIINAQRLSISKGAGISVGTFGQGNAGKLNVNAVDAIEVTGYSGLGEPSELSASVDATATGQGGDLLIATGLLKANNRGAITVSSQGVGQGGNLKVNARSIVLENQGKLNAETASGQGGDITLNVQDLLLLRDSSAISATAGTERFGGDGGNIAITTNFIVAIPKDNSDISANAFSGAGGKVTLTSQGIFGLKFRPQLTDLSDITASSQFGSSGTVILNAPDNSNLQNSLTQLPNNNIDTNKLLAQTCLIRQDQPEGTFYITGTGGIPNRPNDPALSDYPTNTIQSTTQIAQKPWKLGDPIVEPQGFYKLADGQMVMSRECDR
jgi:filamentous hemagglutinin family protein